MTKITIALGALVLVAGVAGCAKTPSSIVPVSMYGAYSGVDCVNAGTLMRTEQQKLAALTNKQNGAVVGDAVGVLLLGVPVSSLVGADVEGDIAASKGKVLALESRLIGC